MKTDTVSRGDKIGVSPLNFRHSDPSQWDECRRIEPEGFGVEQQLRRYAAVP